MNRQHDLLERLHAANPVPGTEHVDPDELATIFSAIEERRGVVTTTRTPVPRQTRPTRRRTLRPAIAFVTASALVLATIGVVALIMRGEDNTTDVGETTSTLPEVTTTAGVVEEPTTATPEPTTVAPEPTTTLVEPAAQPFVLTLSEQPETGTRMALDQNGMPVLVSLAIESGAETGTVRMFRFAEDFELEVVDLFEREWHAQPAELAVGPSGDVYLLEIGPGAETDLAVLRDGELIDLPDVFEHGQVGAHSTDWPIAFDATGNPVLLDFRSGAGEETDALALVHCIDLLCGDHERVFIEEGAFLWPEDELVIDGDRVIVTYSPVEPEGPPDPEAGWDSVPFGSTWKQAAIDLRTHSVEIDALTDGYVPAPEPVSAWPENVFETAELENLLGANIQLAVCSDAECTSREVTTIATNKGWWFYHSLNVEEAADGTIYLAVSIDGESAEYALEPDPGLTLYVFPGGEIGEGVEPIAGTAEPGWPAL